MKASVKSRAWSPRCLKSCPAPGRRMTAPFPSRGRRGRRRVPRRAPPWGAARGRPMVRPACRDWDFLVAESFLGDPTRPACGRVGLNAPESKKAPGDPLADRAGPPRPGIFFQGPPQPREQHQGPARCCPPGGRAASPVGPGLPSSQGGLPGGGCREVALLPSHRNSPEVKAVLGCLWSHTCGQSLCAWAIPPFRKVGPGAHVP